MAEGTLFDESPYRLANTTPAGERPKVSPDARRTQRQAEAIVHNAHPLTAALGYTIRLHPDAPRGEDRKAPGPRCGTCWYRVLINRGHAHSHPKCMYPDDRGAETYERLGPPRVTGGAGTDVRKWWPACEAYSPGDPALSTDAARYIPSEEATDATA